jgi:hypothetical protein
MPSSTYMYDVAVVGAGPRERPLRSVPAGLTLSHDHLIQAVRTAKLKGDPLLDKADSLMARLPLSGDIGIFNGGGLAIQQSSSPADNKSSFLRHTGIMSPHFTPPHFTAPGTFGYSRTGRIHLLSFHRGMSVL